MVHCEIHSNLEKLFGLTGIWFAEDGQAIDEPLVLVSVSDGGWLCLSRSQSRSRIVLGNVIVGFTYRGKIYQLEARTSDTSCGDGMLQVQFTESLPVELEKEINEYLRIDSNAERRRGIRYAVGLKENKWILFGLKSQHQILHYENKMIDVVISNVSSHGALVTGLMDASLVVGRAVVNLQVKFLNPQETLILPALVVRIDRPIPTLAQYALKFIDPLSIRWMKRVDSYAKNF